MSDWRIKSIKKISPDTPEPRDIRSEQIAAIRSVVRVMTDDQLVQVKLIMRMLQDNRFDDIREYVTRVEVDR